MRYTILFLALLCGTIALHAQAFPEAAIKKNLSADKIEMDAGNEDGVFKARHQKTKKWGMYQYTYDGVKCIELIPMQYDSLRYFPFNGAFTIVYNDGKLGCYLSYWSYETRAKQSVPCLYQDYQRYDVEGTVYLAVKRDDAWGWVNWLTGEEMTEFIYDTKENLPYPTYTQSY
ncbi:MAG: hypothetical protein LPK45_03115 [Bacteroidota bacterium]|nr:hypothetical protein [Bacteroidota bacterium]MDX5430034.1 hypothetical protein [Bacteroidota bacterium]MDX5468804.1 hypothetical protein [Bacteroidota bacterium]